MYELTRFAKNIEFCGYVECTELFNFNGKLFILDVRIIWIGRNF